MTKKRQILKKTKQLTKKVSNHPLVKRAAETVRKPKSKGTKSIQQQGLTYVKSRNKKVSGRWRTIFYFKDSKGKIHQKMQPDLRKEQIVSQPRGVIKNTFAIDRKDNRLVPAKTMTKKLPIHLMQAMKLFAKDDFEHSIAIDFERRLTQPQRVVVMKGGRGETIKIQDFEFYGHTHPGSYNSAPSFIDLKSMKRLEPEFIVAGKTGQTNIINVEDPKKLSKFVKKRGNITGPSFAVEQKDINHQLKRKKYKELLTLRNPPMLYKIRPSNITKTPTGREMFFDITGVKVYPLKEKATVVEMLDDPKLEKGMPTVPKEYLEKYHKEL